MYVVIIYHCNILNACGVMAVSVAVVIWKKEHISSRKAGHKKCQSYLVL